MNFRRTGMFACALIALALSLTGCASSGMSSDMSMSKNGPVMITNGHGQVAFVTSSPSGLMIAAPAGMEKCEQCMTDVATYMKTGMIDPVCKVCGAKRMAMAWKPAGHG